MNTTAKGSAAERFVAKWLREGGWLVGSLRHSKGAGDLLAVHPMADGLPGPNLHGLAPGFIWLIEVKSCKELWQQFRREDRRAMRETPLPPGGERWVVNKLGNELIWVAEKDWP